ncbi:MAG: aspartyl protease family protein [Myxococcales bacterium]|nr:aspartyl protease family protein [Myxococcales bacterium]
MRAFLSILVVGCSGPTESSETTPSSSVDTGTTLALDDWLADTHHRATLHREATGHVAVDIGTPQGPTRFIVDSGASVSVLAEDLAAQLGVSGAPGTLTSVTGLDLEGEPLGTLPVVVLDLGLPGTGVTGILGAPFLAQNHAVIDFGEEVLHHGSEAASDDAGAWLLEQGFDEVTLTVDLIDFLTLEGEVDGAGPLHTVVDTGAPTSVMALSAAEDLGLELEPAKGKAATVGGVVESFVTPTETLALGGLQVAVPQVLVLDLSNINGQLQAAGLPRIDLLVGGDLLLEHEGVLHYDAERMFLRL